MNTKHIAGPWFARHVTIQNGKGGSQRWHILAGKDRSIQVCSLLGWDEDDEANARLIAAAPELLEALKNLLESYGAYVDIDEVTNADIVEPVREARAAIAKAKGSK